MNVATCIFNRPQLEASLSKARETFVIGGLGMGKSFLIAALALRPLALAGACVLIAAPTFGMLTEATLVQVQEAWSSFGMTEGDGPNDHYVVGKRPPKSWGVRPFSLLNGNKIMTTRYGSYVVFGSLDRFNRLRGGQYDEIFVDEFRDVKAGARDVLTGRLRGKAYSQRGLKHRAWFVTTPPENPAELRRIIESRSDDIAIIRGTSYDNSAHLPAGYLEHLRSSYDPDTFAREVMGELIRVGGRTWLHAFSRNIHVGRCEPDLGNTLILSFDFNIDPMTCIAAQHDGGQIRILKEWRMRNTTLYSLCDDLRQFIRPWPRTEVTGDASGQNRNPLLKENVHAYHIIKEALNLPRSAFRLSSANPPHSESHMVCNSLFAKAADIRIDPSCVHLIEDCETVQADDDGGIKKGEPLQGHLFDCLRYYLHNYHHQRVPRRYDRPKYQS